MDCFSARRAKSARGSPRFSGGRASRGILDRIRRGIMDWAKRERPELVGHTEAPAYWWFKHGEVRARLHSLGFARVVDMWQLRATSGEAAGWRRVVIESAARHGVARTVGNLVVPGMEYLAIKPVEELRWEFTPEAAQVSRRR